jgi:hypothetical protein
MRCCDLRPDFLWNRYRAVFRSGRVLHRPHSQRRNARRHALQPPSRYDLDLNLKTPKAMGLAAPVNVLSLADEVIE